MSDDEMMMMMMRMMAMAMVMMMMVMLLEEDRSKERKYWVHPINKKRKRLGGISYIFIRYIYNIYEYNAIYNNQSMRL